MSANQKKAVFVTGAGRGIGRVMARKLIDAGYVVSGCARSLEDLKESQNLTGGKLRIQQVDVKKADQLQQWFASEIEHFQKSGITPWGLVTVAGIHGPIGPFLENSWEHWKESIETNLYGTALATRIFAQSLLASKTPGRIAVISGGGATQPMPAFTSYSASKAAVVRFAETLAQELIPYKITVNAIAPGAINTRLTEEVIKAGPEKVGKAQYEKVVKQKKEGGSNPELAAGLAVYLMSDDAGNVTGRLISAVWDSWTELHNLNWGEKNDIYTLRRITPEDRSL